MANGASRLPMTSIAVSLSQLLSNYSPNDTVLLIGHTLSSSAVTPVPGYEGAAIPQYTPTQLPNFGDVDTTMQWLEDNGFVFNFGISTTIDLPVPDSVSLSSGVATLTWTTRPTGFDQLTASGTGTVTQTGSAATGTYAGFGTSGYSILVSGITGTFDDTAGHTIEVVLNTPSASTIDGRTSDEIVCMIYAMLSAAAGAAATSGATQGMPNIYFAYMPSTETAFGDGDLFEAVLGGSVYYSALVMPYEITSTIDITTTYAAFFTTVLALNDPSQVNYQKYGTIGYWSTISVVADDIPNLVMNDSQYSAGMYFPYDNDVEAVYQYPGQVAAAAVAYIITNPAPFLPLGKVEINGLVPPVVNAGLTYQLCESVLDKGYTPIFINQDGMPAFARTITGLTTYPNTSAPATQYYDIQNWQVIFFNKGVKGAILQSPQFTNKNFTQRYRKDLRLAMIDVDKGFERATMVSNVNQYLSQYTVTQNNVGTVLVANPLQVTAGVQSIAVTINLQNQFNANTF